jgi:hypothetical protein
MRLRLTIALTALVAATSLAACGDGDETTTVTTSAPAASTTTSTPSTSTTSTTSSTTTTSTESTTTGSTTTESEDVSGNCDEAEHAEDPECTGGAPPDDSSGSGSGGTSYGSD